MITGERDMHGTLSVTRFAQISAVFGPAVMLCDDLFRDVVGFELFIIALTFFLFICGRLLWHTYMSASVYSASL